MYNQFRFYLLMKSCFGHTDTVECIELTCKLSSITQLLPLKNITPIQILVPIAHIKSFLIIHIKFLTLNMSIPISSCQTTVTCIPKTISTHKLLRAILIGKISATFTTKKRNTKTKDSIISSLNSTILNTTTVMAQSMLAFLKLASTMFIIVLFISLKWFNKLERKSYITSSTIMMSCTIQYSLRHSFRRAIIPKFNIRHFHLIAKNMNLILSLTIASPWPLTTVAR